MRLTIEPTAQIVELNGVQCRVWKGSSDRGTRCDLFIALIAVADDEGLDAQAVFSRELLEKKAPTAPNWWPARMVLPDE